MPFCKNYGGQGQTVHRCPRCGPAPNLDKNGPLAFVQPTGQFLSHHQLAKSVLELDKEDVGPLESILMEIEASYVWSIDQNWPLKYALQSIGHTDRYWAKLEGLFKVRLVKAAAKYLNK